MHPKLLKKLILHDQRAFYQSRLAAFEFSISVDEVQRLYTETGSFYSAVGKQLQGYSHRVEEGHQIQKILLIRVQRLVAHGPYRR